MNTLHTILHILMFIFMWLRSYINLVTVIVVERLCSSWLDIEPIALIRMSS